MKNGAGEGRSGPFTPQSHDQRRSSRRVIDLRSVLESDLALNV